MKFIETLDPIDWADVPLTELKYKRVDTRLLNSLHPKVRFIVDKMLNYEVKKYDKCLLDVKVRDLKKDDFSCFLRTYHYDWVKNLDHPNKHETHFIYTNVNGTEFADGTKCIDNSIYEFGRELHKGTLMNTDVRRVLIRLSYVDHLKNR